MIGQAIPLFESGNLLTKEMLLSLKSFTFDFGELLHHGYSDGILTGCQVTITDKQINLNKGILLFHGKLYIIDSALTEEYYPTEEVCLFKIHFKEEVRTQNFLYREIETSISPEPIDEPSEMELCRFKLQKGFYLRDKYKDFKDRVTEYDTVNTIHSPFSSYGESSLSPEVTYAFAQYIRETQSKDPLDCMFSMEVYQSNGRALNKKAIITYIEMRLGVKRDTYSNEDLFYYLSEIIDRMDGVPTANNTTQKAQRMILMD